MKTTHQYQIAEWLGQKATTLSNILNGRRYPSREKAARLAEVSGVSLEVWLLSDRKDLREKVFAAFEARGGDLRKNPKERGKRQIQIEKGRGK